MRVLFLDFLNMLGLDLTKQERNGLFLAERLVKLDPIAVEILKLVDGERSVRIIASELSKI